MRFKILICRMTRKFTLKLQCLTTVISNTRKIADQSTTVTKKWRSPFHNSDNLKFVKYHKLKLKKSWEKTIRKQFISAIENSNALTKAKRTSWDSLTFRKKLMSNWTKIIRWNPVKDLHISCCPKNLQQKLMISSKSREKTLSRIWRT